ncbi:MAG: M48 family metallopeptidase [Elusimicrobiota bacterium]|nr:M48 family metallopeptidase [Elusimicrobiota bacterium]
MVTSMTGKKARVNPAPAEVKFRLLVAEWAKKIGATPARVRFQLMAKKWASCSNSGQITFSTALFAKPRKFQEAVIVHELVHLLVPNHGKLFKSMFLSFIPGGDSFLNDKKQKAA